MLCNPVELAASDATGADSDASPASELFSNNAAHELRDAASEFPSYLDWDEVDAAAARSCRD